MMAMARRLYPTANPDDSQLTLFYYVHSGLGLRGLNRHTAERRSRFLGCGGADHPPEAAPPSVSH